MCRMCIFKFDLVCSKSRSKLGLKQILCQFWKDKTILSDTQDIGKALVSDSNTRNCCHSSERKYHLYKSIILIQVTHTHTFGKTKCLQYKMAHLTDEKRPFGHCTVDQGQLSLNDSSRDHAQNF